MLEEEPVLPGVVYSARAGSRKESHPGAASLKSVPRKVGRGEDKGDLPVCRAERVADAESYYYYYYHMYTICKL